MADDDVVEREYMGKSKSRVWTYLILMVVLIGVALLINLVWLDPGRASAGMHSVVGLPAWALATITFLIGAVIFWLGLKMETDWPEAIGAFFISGSIVWFELIVGFHRVALGGVIVIPYLLPIVVFVGLLIYGMKRSV
ncbi:hypothetical protein BH11MYX2_BH11MYX2_36590 [soil metagenome]